MSLMNPRYPNLELIEYKSRQLLLEKHAAMQFEAIVFPQLWGSTCTGFDITKDGNPAIGGCAMTKEYTTVMHETTTDTWLVFFGHKPCYKVKDADEKFMKDLDERNMAGFSEARKRY